VRFKLEAHFFDFVKFSPFSVVADVVQYLSVAVLITQKVKESVLSIQLFLWFGIYCD